MISIVIANYNKKDLLKKCIDAVMGQTAKDIEVIIVDNASSDGSVEMVEAGYQHIKLIKNNRNLLFSEAYNRGIEESKGEFILCLNNDCFLDADYLKQALCAMNLDAGIGIVSGKILRIDKKTIDSTGLFLGRNRKPVERGYGQKDKGQYEKPGYVFGVSGSCAFFRRGMLLDIKDRSGYFDEDLGIYYEDLDLCWRARKKKWKAYYAPKAVAYHVRGGTAISDPGLNKACNLRFPLLPDGLKKKYIINRYKCMLKNDTFFGFLINLPFILWYDFKIWLYVILTFFLDQTNQA